MTGRVTAVLAGIAAMTAVVALAVHPFLHGHDATPPAGRTRGTDELYKWLKANGLGPTKKVSGD